MEELIKFHNFNTQSITQLSEEIVLFKESYGEYHYMTEKMKDGIFDRLKNFFRDMRMQFEHFISDLKVQITSSIRKKDVDAKMKKMRDALKEKKDAGIQTVQVIDMWKYRDMYLKMNSELWVYAKKFSKVSYTKTWQIEDDLAEFTRIVEDYDSRIKMIKNSKITMDTAKVLDFYEDEIRGKSEVIATLEQAMKEFQEMEELANNLEKRTERLGAEVLPEHIGLIRSVCLKITSFIHRNVVKFITTVLIILP